ncbi:MAG TPA: ABC transporter permease, partial [Clostridia bacterium]|nr:ABC transporter permease [Clostridia bacterium]
MTFHEISKKMLLANFRRYTLFFYCNVFSVALFYCFSALFTNSTFMNPKIVDSMISSNIIAPSVFVGIFLLLSVPYSYQAFLKNRKREYGIFMALGMSHAEVLKNMLFESGVVAGLALGAGLILGTTVSVLFSCILCHVLGISALRWYLNADSYRVTTLFFGLTVLLLWAVTILGFFQTQLIDWMKGKFRAEKTGRASPVLLAAGAILIVVSILTVEDSGKGDVGSILLASLAGVFVGLWLIFANVRSMEPFLAARFPSFGKHHLVEISFVRQHLRSQRRIGAAAVGLIGFSVFFAGLCAAAYPSFMKNVKTYSPYDLVYCQTEGKNQADDASIKSLLSRNGVAVRSEKQVPYLRDTAFNLIAVSEANREFSCSYQVPAGKFITVFPYDLNDGYRRE